MSLPNIKILSIQENFGAQVNNINLAEPIEKKTFVKIQSFLHKFGVLHFPNQNLTPAKLSVFTKLWGEPDIHHLAEHTFPEYPEVRVLSNVMKDGKLVGAFRGGNFWHSDLSYLEKTGYEQCHGIECPAQGGDIFADMQRLYKFLPTETKFKLKIKWQCMIVATAIQRSIPNVHH